MVATSPSEGRCRSLQEAPHTCTVQEVSIEAEAVMMSSEAADAAAAGAAAGQIRYARSCYRCWCFQVLEYHETSLESGLPAEVVAERLERFGPNELQHEEGKSLFQLILE